MLIAPYVILAEQLNTLPNCKMAVFKKSHDYGCADFQKCGDILFGLKLQKRIYGFNCYFCEEFCLQFDSFLEHLENMHSKSLCDGLTSAYEANVEESFEMQTNDIGIYEKSNGDNIIDTDTTPNDLQLDHLKSPQSVVDDPLNEHTANEISEEESKGSISDEISSIVKLAQINTSLCVNDLTDDETIDDANDSQFDDSTDLNENCKTDKSHTNSDAEENDSNDDDDKVAMEMFNNKKIMLDIIQMYEKYRLLWDTSEPNYNSQKKRSMAFKKITSAINKQKGLNLKSTSVVVCFVKKLRYKYRTELQNIKLAELRQQSYKPKWYHNRLKFLSTCIKYKQRSKRGAKALANERSPLPLPNLNHEQNIALIKIYESFPCLWDVHHIGFRFKNQRHEASEEMLLTIKQEMGITLTSEELQRKLYRIRYACTQEKHRKLECERQQKKFTPNCKYYDEIRFLCDNVGPFKCEYCGDVLHGSDQYKVHKWTHDGAMPFTCPICKRGFMKVGNCTVHLRRHTRDFPFACKVCGKGFATTTDINVHMRSHTGEKPYFCEICGQSFRTGSFFGSHQRRHQKSPSFKCSICPKTFYENARLTEHMKSHLNVRDKVCNVCNKAFTSAKYLRQHKQIHSDQKKYICKICSKSFAQYAGLSGHMKRHGTT